MTEIVAATEPRSARLPGTARPRREVLAEYQEELSRRRAKLDRVLWPLFTTDAEKMYRWRIQLSCGCVHEVMTHGHDKLPHEQQWRDPVNFGSLPAGRIVCTHPTDEPSPYREVTEWRHSRIQHLEADPVETPDGYSDETWQIVRRDEARDATFWTVELSCGHGTEISTSDGWKPADGFRTVSPERQAEMHAEVTTYFAETPADGQRDVLSREHWLRMIDRGWPVPVPEHSCWTCLHARTITAYQRIGWLVPPPKTEAEKVADKQTAVRRRLAQAEAEVARLRVELRGDPT